MVDVCPQPVDLAVEAFRLAERLLKKPEDVVAPNAELEKELVSVTAGLYSALHLPSKRQRCLSGEELRPGSSKKILHVEGLHDDQIWEQLDDANCLSKLKATTRQFTRAKVKELAPEAASSLALSFIDETKLAQEEEVLQCQTDCDNNEAVGSDVDEVQDSSDFDDDDDDDQIDESTGDEEDMDSDEADGIVDSGGSDSEEGERKISRNVKIKKSVGSRGAKTAKASEVDDAFFKLSEMEAFVQEAEEQERALRSKLTAKDRHHDSDGAGMNLDGDVDEDLEDDDDADGGGPHRYEDFFDSPDEAEGGETFSGMESEEEDGEEEEADSDGGDEKKRTEKRRVHFKSRDGDDSDDGGEGFPKGDTEKLTGEELKLEKQLKRVIRKEKKRFGKPLKDEVAGSKEESDEGEGEGEDEEGSEADESKLNEVEVADVLMPRKSRIPEKSELGKLARRQERLDNLIDEVELSLVGEKHWSMMGEVDAKHRDLNSLLSVNLELPQYFHQQAAEALPESLGQEESEVPGATEDFASAISKYIEKVVKRRIKDLAFDDVTRKAELPPSKRGENTETAIDLDFKKSRVGLADVYAEHYEREILGLDSKIETELGKKRTEVVRLFAKVMYKLDALSHQRVLPKPIKSTTTDKNVAAVVVEDLVPTMLSESHRVAPEELQAPRYSKEKSEMTREEKLALRSALKTKKRKVIVGKLKSGEIGLQESARDAAIARKGKSTLATPQARMKPQP